jgi:hypothetical protein
LAIAKTGVSLQKLKEHNKLLILQAVREYGPVSRIEIGRMLGLSNTTSMALARELAVQGFIREKGQGNSSGGRKPVLLEINPRYRYIIGLVLSAEGVPAGYLIGGRGPYPGTCSRKFTTLGKVVNRSLD